jgi:hypothetical protein
VTSSPYHMIILSYSRYACTHQLYGDMADFFTLSYDVITFDKLSPGQRNL